MKDLELNENYKHLSIYDLRKELRKEHNLFLEAVRKGLGEDVKKINDRIDVILLILNDKLNEIPL